MKVFIAFFTVLTLYSLYHRGGLEDSFFDVYQVEGARFKGSINFKDVSKEFGISYTHLVYDPETGDTNLKSAEARAPLPFVVVSDFNRDGYMDMLFLQSHPDKPNHLYINQKGKGFEERAHEYNLAYTHGGYVNSTAAVFDVDNDGDLDIYFGRYGCDALYVNDKGSYREKKMNLCSYPYGINIADFNNNGYQDVVLANFLPMDYLKREGVVYEPTRDRSENYSGGLNFVLLNVGGYLSVFEDTSFYILGKTTDVGVADVNNDGNMDIFFSNDLTYDGLYINDGKARFVNETDRRLPKTYHGFAGMNSEFADFNDNGFLDLYVSNIYKPPFTRTFNLLWENNGEGFYQNVSVEKNVAKCGWSWGGKFADFNNNGMLDLIVTNGYYVGKRVSSENMGESYWYYKSALQLMPPYIRNGDPFKLDYENLNHSGYERNCLFQKSEDGTYFDIAEQAGVDSYYSGRGLVLVDLDNNGQMDFVVANYGGPAQIYKNTSQNDNNWIGFEFIDKYGTNTPHGTKALIKGVGGKKRMYQISPLNGFRGQSDPRIVYGLGSDRGIDSLEVVWPDGKKEKFESKNINQYNKIIYGSGVEKN